MAHKLSCGVLRILKSNTFAQNVPRTLENCKLGRSFPNLFYSQISESTKPEAVGLKISDQCIQRLKKVAGEKMLRVLVDGGGCSGYQYKFELDSTMNPDDRLFEQDGAKIVIDEISLEYLDGATVDYHEELIRSAFRIVSNPKAEQGCSCGASFAVKL